MRILITGGFGFIGGRLGQHLQQNGHQVILGSRKASCPPEWLPHAEVAQIDWSDSRALKQICSRVDVVIQAAGMNAQDCAADPVAALEFNGLVTARIVAAASQVGVKRFIYLSTARVYASPLAGTFTEESYPHNLHPYATSHLAGEHAVLGANQLGKIKGIVLRLSNVIGAPVHKDVNCWMLLVNDLCKQAVQTRKLKLQISSLQQRDFISITEVCRVAEHLAVGNGSSIQSSIFNVGSGVSQSIFTMMQLIQQRCKQVLGFEPILELEQGGVDEQQPMLIFRAHNLAAHGIKTNALANTVEIDSLLRFCQSTFTQAQSLSA
jgi:UDP-glucose 4-epimerase